MRWVNFLHDQKQTTRSINKMLSHVRSLVDYAWQLERLDRNVLDGFHLKEPESTPLFDSLSIEEAQSLMRAFGRQTREERRLRAMMLILYGCGLRTRELCSLNVSSIDVEKQELKVLGKGDKERLLPLSEPLHLELQLYLADRKVKHGPLFKTLVKTTRIRPNDVLSVVQVAAKRAQLTKKVTPKSLRHAFASHLLNQGVDIAIISSLMGHRSPKETGVYIHAEEKNLRAAIFRMDLPSEEPK
jgi:site-specific recombinase XerD